MIFATTFRITLATYLLLLVAEALHPGFVSNVISAHWILLLSLFAFAGALFRGESLHSKDASITAVMILAALVGGVVTWTFGVGLGAWRPLLSLVAILLPFAIGRLSMVE